MSLQFPHGSRRASVWRPFIAMLALCAALAFAACGDDEDDSSSTTAPASTTAAVDVPAGALLQDGTLTSGSESDFPPYDFLDESGEYAGFDADLTKALSKVLGLESRVIDTQFTSLIPGLQSRKFDAIISMLYITAERARQVDYIPYVNVTSSFLVEEGGDFQPQVPTDLCGKRVAVNKGSYNEQLLGGEIARACKARGEEVPAIRSFPTDTQAAHEVSGGRADVNFEDTGTAVYRVKQQENLGLELSNDEPLYPIAVGMAVRKGDTAMRGVIEDGLAALQEDGTFQELLDEWGLEPADMELAQKAMSGT
ncbi:MAG TPA: ABC transporter substrate-binding protein [Conexibacter sp.]|nr:ABC transporter substrate-binding protein [Conexibacter sp.]